MVKVHPRSRRPGLQGTVTSAAGPRLKVAVTEAAEDGKANRAVCDMLAERLDRPRAAVRILAGASSREKVVSVAGEVSALVGKLNAL